MTISTIRIRLVLAALAVWSFAAQAAPAATTNWNVSLGSFTSASSWDNGVPDAGDTAVFRRGDGPLVSAVFGNIFTGTPARPTINRLIVGTNTVALAGVGSSTLTVHEAGHLDRFGGDMIVGETATDVAVLNMNLANLTVDDATLGSAAGSSGTLNLTASNATFNVTGSDELYDLIVGSSGTGTININSGAELDVDVGLTVLGFNSTGVGNVSVSGSGAMWTSLAVTVGGAGAGTFAVSGGGHVITNGGGSSGLIIGGSVTGVGTVTVHGSESFLGVAGNALIVGNKGDGTLNITGGGEVISTNNAFICNSPGSAGRVTVDGAGSTWTNGTDVFGALIGFIDVGTGLDTNGMLDVTRGGAVTTGSIQIGGYGTGEVTVDGTGSTLKAALRVGYVGQVSSGTLNVTNGGQVVASSVRIGYYQEGATGEVVVDGIGSQLLVVDDINQTPTDCYVGETGAGALAITNGAQVNNGNAYIGFASGSTGAVTIDGIASTWTNNGDLYVGDAGNGSLTVTNDGTVSAANIIVGALGSIDGDGNIVGVVQNGGLVAPGTSPGSLNIDGNYTQAADGALLIELAATGYDQLLVTGVAALDGTLTVNLLDGFTPSVGESFTILSADDVNGTFTTEVFPAMPNLDFDVIYNAQSVVLSVLSTLPGDFDGDGDVDGADFVAWQTNFPKAIGATLAQGDADADGDVDGADFVVWQTHFPFTPGPGAAPVPEPTAFILALAAVATNSAIGRVIQSTFSRISVRPPV